MTEGLHLDAETKSLSDLRKVGVHKYAEDPSTTLWGFAYQLGTAPIRRWMAGEPLPLEVREHVALGGTVIAHNAQFERVIWNKVVCRDYDVAPLAIEQMSCTYVRALALNLPGDLNRLAEVLGLTQQKDDAGHRLMLRMAKPRSYAKDGTPIWWDERVERLMEYCEQDVRTEIEADKHLYDLTPTEKELWYLDQRINERGVPLDVLTVQRAISLAAYAKERANDSLLHWTDGIVKSCNNVPDILWWLNQRGILAETLRKDDYEWLLNYTEIVNDKPAHEVVQLRANAAKLSTAKFSKMENVVCKDGYMRGLLQFDGASQTGRWAGRLVQPQNFPRVDDESEEPLVEWVTGLLRASYSVQTSYELVETLGPPKLPSGDAQNGQATLPWLAKCLRSCIAAPPGYRLIGADFANVEGRVNAWLSGEHWKIKAFEAYDQGTGEDLYKLAFSRSFNVPVSDITKPLRQIGKVQELALGYAGGVGAILKMSRKLHEIARAVIETCDPEQWEKTALLWEHARDRKQLPQYVWTALKIIVTNWRKDNSAIVKGWYECNDAAIAAIENPNMMFPVYGGRVHYIYDESYLHCILPSGRAIFYPNPCVLQDVVDQIYDGLQWVDFDVLDPVELDGMREQGYRVRKSKRRGVRFYALDERNQWVRHRPFGGFFCENIVQAVARDLLVYGMQSVEAADYPIRLTVHDEVLSLVRNDYGSVDEFQQLMSKRPTWAGGLPVVAKAWEGSRYNK